LTGEHQRLRRFAACFIKSQGRDGIAATVAKLTGNVRREVEQRFINQEGKNLLVRIVVMLTKMCFVRSKIEHEHEHVYVLRSRQYA
jgi:hypothetical protein